MAQKRGTLRKNVQYVEVPEFDEIKPGEPRKKFLTDREMAYFLTLPINQRIEWDSNGRQIPANWQQTSFEEQL